MTIMEFKSKLPGRINHKSDTETYLEILVDKPDEKGACYRHRDYTASYGTYGESWQEVYDKISKGLKMDGYMK